MRKRTPLKSDSRGSNDHSGAKPDAYDRLYADMQQPRQRRALESLRDITIQDLQRNYRPGETEGNPRD